MPVCLSASQATELRRIARPYKKRAKLGKPWTKRTDDELWRKVLGQIAVVGRAAPGERLQQDPEIGRKVSIKKLNKFRNDAELQKYLHRVFVRLGVRYVGRSWNNDKKAAAGTQNFRRLMKAGGPKRFFERIASCKTEDDRIEVLQRSLKFYGNKGARDTLIDLGLAENCMALDVRIFGVLNKVGVKVAPDDIYRQIEKELIEKVAIPLRISGALLDRILFQNYDQILRCR
ncbi:MAG: hypothetical protein WBY66_15165 [Candidatus Acidiferrales bacterium]